MGAPGGQAQLKTTPLFAPSTHWSGPAGSSGAAGIRALLPLLGTEGDPNAAPQQPTGVTKTPPRPSSQQEQQQRDQPQQLDSRDAGSAVASSRQSPPPPAAADIALQRSSSLGIAGALRYLAATRVQPKAPLEECPHASEEIISASFRPSACGGGIRSLPAALAPGFRQLVYAQLVCRGRESLERTRSQAAAGAVAPRGMHGSSLFLHARAAQLQKQRLCWQQRWLAAGSSGLGEDSTVDVPGRFAACHGIFSLYRHSVSEYGLARAAQTRARLESKAAQVSASDFVVRGCPPAVRGEPAFSVLTFDSRPFVETDHLGRARRRGDDPALAAASVPAYGTFLPPGRAGAPAAALHSRAPELLTLLSQQLTRDFPLSFLQAFEDSHGAVVVSFSCSAAEEEGDVHAYMSNFAKAAPLALQFRLCKDASRWGLVEDQGDSAFFALRPPWAPARTTLPESLSRPPPPPPPRREASEVGVLEPVLRRQASEARGLGIRGLLL